MTDSNYPDSTMSFKDYLDPYQLSQAGLPSLLKDEQILQQEEKLSIYFGEVKQYRKGKCVLTTHRILWTDGGQRHAIHLKHIQRTQSKVKQQIPQQTLQIKKQETTTHTKS